MAPKKTLLALIPIMIIFAIGCSKESGEPDNNGDAAGSAAKESTPNLAQMYCLLFKQNVQPAADVMVPAAQMAPVH